MNLTPKQAARLLNFNGRLAQAGFDHIAGQNPDELYQHGAHAAQVAKQFATVSKGTHKQVLAAADERNSEKAAQLSAQLPFKHDKALEAVERAQPTPKQTHEHKPM